MKTLLEKFNIVRKSKSFRYGLSCGMCIAMLMVIMLAIVGGAQARSTYDELMQKWRDTEYQYQVELSRSERELSVIRDQFLQLQKELEDTRAQLEEQLAYEESIKQKFWYVFQKAPAGGGVDFDLVKYTDELCKQRNVNPHIVWCIVDGESGYNANAQNSSSSARGLGQFLRSTAKVMYENYLGYGTYDHSYAFDPYVNIDMMVMYLSYLQGVCGGSTPAMLRSYSGASTNWYYNVISGKMAAIGCSASINTYV